MKKLHSLIGKELIDIISENTDIFQIEAIPVLKNQSSKIAKVRHYKARTEKDAKILNVRHSQLQEKLREKITAKYKSVELEVGFENYAYQIDLLAKKKNGNYDIYEVKPYSSSIYCIREALGQLLHYRYLVNESYKNSNTKEKNKVDTIYIAGPSDLSIEGKKLLKSIQNDFKTIKFDYIKI